MLSRSVGGSSRTGTGVMEPTASKRTFDQCDAETCCVCFNAFEASGARTKVYNFTCGAHSTCRACDRTLYERHADKCPTCRASRDVDASFTVHGARGPAPINDSLAFFGGWGGHGGPARMFFATDTSGIDGGVDFGGFRRAAALRHSRSIAPDPTAFFAGEQILVVDDDDSSTSTSTDDAVAAAIIEATARDIRNDVSLQAALGALCDVASTNLANFSRLVHRRPIARVGRARSNTIQR